MLKQVTENLSVAIRESGAEVTSDPLPTITADEVQFAQVIQNLISNGIKFHSEGVRPEVHVSAERGENEWIFSVKDNGIGMSPEDQDRIFKVFTRVGDTTKYGGTGIGLAVCKRIVERHGGRIWVESEPGKGSTFFFAVPDRPAAEMQKAA